MFFSSLKKQKKCDPKQSPQANPAPVEEIREKTNGEVAPEALAQTASAEAKAAESAPDDSGASASRGILLGKLFHKQEGYAGPESSYENESWAPEPYVGLFRKNRAPAEEQLPSSSAAQ
ncbi:Hypothetical protein DEACI_2745 [Acididesulfobacillus acetoxydans]|uniref:Uncharacterized protein n=1 Tax=Acididesulfobacillus acetoxydans TaxID=1561005 RepID=A0A8S0VXN0_9FIRM|nr:hypothetical protein [Acididesulfobacillus acetoxydans]CAA7602073.1 Hypothetical protein DEACI_2745 [Acididesulfobacillus acetoxydans]CEJ08084.1 Hypothetical protein DEACI_2559 [Acididesulfobacillus acetoxydans]